MPVDRHYVDSHGQSEVALAFCRLPGFQLLPRLKAIHSQKWYRPEAGSPKEFPNLQVVLSRSINWELIGQQYDQMVKYATAFRLGTAETEAILRRFTRSNLQHPTYKALTELGKAIKMIQRVVTDPAWKKELTTEDLRGLTPLIYGHVNPYGTFRLDMSTRVALGPTEKLSP